MRPGRTLASCCPGVTSGNARRFPRAPLAGTGIAIGGRCRVILRPVTPGLGRGPEIEKRRESSEVPGRGCVDVWLRARHTSRLADQKRGSRVGSRLGGTKPGPGSPAPPDGHARPLSGITTPRAVQPATERVSPYRTPPGRAHPKVGLVIPGRSLFFFFF
jgi:hypothetical protein